MRGYVKPDDARLYGPDDGPSGYRWVAVADPAWRVLPEEKRNFLCRRIGPGHLYCQNFGAAEVARGRSTTTSRFGHNWWVYCADHLYGRWIQDGVVMSWRLEKEDL